MTVSRQPKRSPRNSLFRCLHCEDFAFTCTIHSRWLHNWCERLQRQIQPGDEFGSYLVVVEDCRARMHPVQYPKPNRDQPRDCDQDGVAPISLKCAQFILTE